MPTPPWSEPARIARIALSPRARRAPRRGGLLRAAASVACLLSLTLAARIGGVAAAPESDRVRIDSQLTFLTHAVDGGADADMQAFFPEGEFFTDILTGLAAAQSGRPAEAERMLDAATRPHVADRFGTIPALEHGTFYRGWTLLLRAELAHVAGRAADDTLQTEADAVAAALVADADGVPESYRDGRWPCDAVVAMAAVVRAHALAGRPTPGLDAWLAKLDKLRDPATGLLPHRLSTRADPTSDGPRGTSQAIIQAFWPAVAPADAARSWAAFRETFVTREWGLVGVREFRRGSEGPADVDTGPLILGVSASASAVTLGAARANGDAALALDLDREAELLGLPVSLPDGRRFAFGLLPVGDAWVAWARSVAMPAQTDANTTDDPAVQRIIDERRPRALLWPWTLPPLLAAAAFGWAAVGRPARLLTRLGG